MKIIKRIFAIIVSFFISFIIFYNITSEFISFFYQGSFKFEQILYVLQILVEWCRVSDKNGAEVLE